MIEIRTRVAGRRGRITAAHSNGSYHPGEESHKQARQGRTDPQTQAVVRGTTAVVVAVAAASAIALTSGSGLSVLTSDTAHNAAVKLAAVPAVTSKTF